MRFKARFITIVFLALAVLILYECAVNPVTGKKELMLISEKQEIALGKETDAGIQEQYGIYDDPELNAYVRRVGEKMTGLSHRPKLQYHFAILDTPVENAFAAPGGYIYITRGLLAMMNSEAELATVLGHELGHVNARHSARSMTRQILFSLGLIVAGELSDDIKKITPFLGIATQLLFLKYSRSDEYQADSLGIEYSRGARYSPTAMVDFFSSISRLTGMSGGGKIPNFLSTHPLTEKRIQKAREQLLNSDRQLAVNGPYYEKKIDGLIFGQNPRQGFIEGNAFFHPDMQICFRIPNGWEIDNTPKCVSMAPKNGNAVIMLIAQPSKENLESFSREKMKNFSNVTILNKGFQTINQYDAYVTDFKSKNTQEDNQVTEIRSQLTNIQKDRMIFTFFAATKAGEYPNYESEIHYAIKSFSRLTSGKHLQKKPLRVYLKTAGGPMFLQEYLTSQGVRASLFPRVALINAMQLHDRLRQGQQIKIIL